LWGVKITQLKLWVKFCTIKGIGDDRFDWHITISGQNYFDIYPTLAIASHTNFRHPWYRVYHKLQHKCIVNFVLYDGNGVKGLAVKCLSQGTVLCHPFRTWQSEVIWMRWMMTSHWEDTTKMKICIKILTIRSKKR